MEAAKRMAERRKLRAEKKRKIDAYYGKKPKAKRRAKRRVTEPKPRRKPAGKKREQRPTSRPMRR